MSKEKKEKASNRVFLKLVFDFLVDESKVTQPNEYYRKVDGIRLALEQAVKQQIPEAFGVEIQNFIIGTDAYPTPGEEPKEDLESLR